MPAERPLPWALGIRPLILAPMQGVTHAELRRWMIGSVRPDAVFTEFMHAGGRGLKSSDRREIAADEGGVPLVVQLIGFDRDHLVCAADVAQELGARHLNLNLGCPYGRMGRGPTGGGLLAEPERLENLLPALRSAISGSFSVKIRSGYSDPEQIFSLLPLLEACDVDFLVIHPRTVQQEYRGAADHTVTARLVAATQLPVIANGDIRRADAGRNLLAESGAAGLMLGRGAIADPDLFCRLRDHRPEPDLQKKRRMLAAYLQGLVPTYAARFCGETQILAKLKEILGFVDDAGCEKEVKALKKSRTLVDFGATLADLAA